MNNKRKKNMHLDIHICQTNKQEKFVLVENNVNQEK